MLTGLVMDLGRCVFPFFFSFFFVFLAITGPYLCISLGADYSHARDPAERHPDLAVSAKDLQGRAVDKFADLAG